MSKSPRCGAAPITSPTDLETLFAEDRAEIEFRIVGAVAQVVSDHCLALRGYRLQLMIVERNSGDPVIRVAAACALKEPSSDTIRVLLKTVRGTPWHPLVQHVLAELAIAHAATVFAAAIGDDK